MPEGMTFDRVRDGERLKSQLDRVIQVVTLPENLGRWWTLRELGEETAAPEASASARLREIRKHGFVVERKFVRRGLHTYRVTEIEP